MRGKYRESLIDQANTKMHSEQHKNKIINHNKYKRVYYYLSWLRALIRTIKPHQVTSRCNELDFWGLMSINKGAHFDKDFKDTPVFEKMMVTSVDTDELLFPCIVY